MVTYLGIGSNLGDREANVELCLSLLEKRVGRLLRRSTGIYSMPVGFDSQNEFLNIAVAVETNLSPFELLDATQAIEHDMGRTEKSHNQVYHDRIIDIDILLYGDLHIQTPQLTLPHPRMQERDFVRLPLAQIQ